MLPPTTDEPMNPQAIHSLDDMRRAARRRMPRFAFDFIDGGAGDESGLERNRTAFRRVVLRPRTLRDVSVRSQAVEIFGAPCDGPIGIAPIGLANLAGPGTDEAFATAARHASVPHVLSTNASTAIERIAELADGRLWFQLYVSEDEQAGLDLMRRAADAGIRVLVVTVDVPAAGRRLRDLRNALGMPLKLTPRTLFELASHPRWSLAMARHGAPDFANLRRYGSEGRDPRPMAAVIQSQMSARLGPDRIRRLRDAWKGHFVVKGVLDPHDAEAAVAIGADGIVVSNHGGRQLAAAPAAIDALPAIARAVGDRATVMLDSGIRCGEDILRAYALGAHYVFTARPFLWGAATAGHAGVERVFEILRQETDQALAQIGCSRIADLGPDYLWEAPEIAGP
jgi:L-lactate dehydrogenase (cytochrome)/(S)-mandelate dehydrogenase